ncbi:phosphate/phosphite/phosphonate ABC transporter substrate-binding protein [bacterium]|nr:phosphate/phosphite/phosphonate ABC transporter substrate-binding protein [bacterium]
MKFKNISSYYFLVVGVILFSLSACSSSANVDYQVDLTDLSPLPNLTQSDVTPLKVAIAAVISPTGTVDSYQPLLDYLSEELGRPIEVEQRRTYIEVNDLIESGEVDLAFVCTSAYIAGREHFGLELLVAPVVNGDSFYNSQLIVSKDSEATSMADLKDAVFAFTDPMSFTGRVYPTYLLQEMGTTPSDFFQRTFFTYSHDDAIWAVANGLADGATVDSLVLEHALIQDPELNNLIKVIHTSPPFGIPPVVVNPDLRPQLKTELETIFLSMHNDSEGQNALQALGIDQYTLVSPELYDEAQQITIDVSGEVTFP